MQESNVSIKNLGIQEQDETKEKPQAVRPKRGGSWRGRLAALVGMVTIGGGIGVASNQGGESDSNSRKAPDAIVAPVPVGMEPQTPQEASISVIQDNVTKPQQEQAKTAAPEMSEDEKRSKITEILQAEYPELLPFLESGQLPYYKEEVGNGYFLRVISLVSDEATNVNKSIPTNQAIFSAVKEHFIDPYLNDGSKSDIRGVANNVRYKTAIVVPERIADMDVPRPAWQVYEGDSDMFTIASKFQPGSDTAVLSMRFGSDIVGKMIDDKNISGASIHHFTGRQPNGHGEN